MVLPMWFLTSEKNRFDSITVQTVLISASLFGTQGSTTFGSKTSTAFGGGGGSFSGGGGGSVASSGFGVSTQQSSPGMLTGIEVVWLPLKLVINTRPGLLVIKIFKHELVLELKKQPIRRLYQRNTLFSLDNSGV